MSMSKKDFIALGDYVRLHYRYATWNDSDARAMRTGNAAIEYDAGVAGSRYEFASMLEMLADFCAEQNPRFKRERWLDYIAGKCGKNGGSIKKAT